MRTRAKTLSFRDKTLASHDSKSKARRGRELWRDRISELPDEIIVYILSLLTMKEAGKSSVLSKRWRYVWAYIPVLNFDASDTIDKIGLDFELLELEKPRYLSWVNQVVGSYRGTTIDEFRVGFDISVTSKDTVDYWVRFATEKRVKRLELDFTTPEGNIENRIYTFECSSICKSLTSLRLVCVSVTDEVFQSFLQSCPGLEYLSVERSTSLRNVEVTEATLSLKSLEIRFCSIEHIKICAPNLVSFDYLGPKISMPFIRTPSLAKLSIRGLYGNYVTNNFLELSSYLVQLEALTLEPFSRIKDIMKSVDQFPQCKKLKQLEVSVCPEIQDSLFCFATLIKACPFLHKFVLKLNWGNPVCKRELRKIEDCLHYHLRIIEIEGFLGNAMDLEFIMYLMKNSVALEKIIINIGFPKDVGTPWEFEVEKNKRIALKQAAKLRKKLKHGADLIILEILTYLD